MSTEDTQSQAGLEDTGAGGPGAPTPLSVLEVSSLLIGTAEYRVGC
jgi:hypothetical protein